MINSKLVSIIIPVYNCEKYLDKCIESVVRQTYKNIEIILINDGSEDKSGQICDYYAENDRRIVVKHKKNEGAAIARNLGISISKGEYISFIDSDDWVEEDYIKFLLKNILSFKSDLVVCNYKEVYISEENIKVQEKSTVSSELIYVNKGINRKFFTDGFIHPCWGKLYKSKIIKNKNIEFMQLKLSEDTVFNLDYLKYCKKVYLLERQLYFYAHYEGYKSVTSIAYKDIFNNYLIVHEKLIEYINKYKKDICKSIVYNTMYPQYYNAFIKILMCKNLKKKERYKILNNALNNKKILDSFKTEQKNKYLKLINRLIICRKYFILKIIYMYINIKNNVIKG